MATVVLLGSVKAWFDGNGLSALEKKRIKLAMDEVAQAGGATSNKTGGILELDGLCFQEYKVNTKSSDPLRYFGYFYGSALNIAAIANDHRDRTYSGCTWDGQDSWPANYVKGSELVDMSGAAFDDELLHRQGKGVPHITN